MLSDIKSQTREELEAQFAAWEQPDLFTEELRAGLRSLRKAQVPAPRSS